MSVTPIGVALVGTGSFAGAHLTALEQIEGVEVRYVIGSDLERASRLASRYPGAVASTAIEDALRDPSVQAVDVCNRTSRHAVDGVAALSAGKHLHVDKPPALSLQDFDRLTQAARDSRRSLAVGMTVRFQPVVTSLRRAIVAGEIGAPRLAHITWYTGHVWPGGWRGWPEMETPDSFVTIARFANGALATLELCYALRQPGSLMRRVVVAGDRATACHDSELDPGLTSPGHTAPPASVERALDIQLGAWIESLRGGPEFPVDNEQVRAALAAALAAQRSLETSRPVRVGDLSHG